MIDLLERRRSGKAMQQQTASEERVGGAGVWGGARPRIYGRREPGAGRGAASDTTRPAVEYSVGGGVGFLLRRPAGKASTPTHVAPYHGPCQLFS